MYKALLEDTPTLIQERSYDTHQTSSHALRKSSLKSKEHIISGANHFSFNKHHLQRLILIICKEG